MPVLIIRGYDERVLLIWPPSDSNLQITLASHISPWPLRGPIFKPISQCFKGSQMGVSKHRGTPKWMVYNGKPDFLIGWFGGTTIFGNTQNVVIQLHFWTLALTTCALYFHPILFLIVCLLPSFLSYVLHHFSVTTSWLVITHLFFLRARHPLEATLFPLNISNTSSIEHSWQS